MSGSIEINNVELSLGVVGPQGAAGPTGPTGPAGSGGAADIADFVFANDGDGVSSMTIANHDMDIITTRIDPETDADITLDSADDVWINANDEIQLNTSNGVVTVITSGEGPNEWTFQQNGNLTLPSGTAAIASGSNGTIITDSRTVTFYADYQDATPDMNQSEAIYLPVNTDTQWFAANTYSTATITFADATSVQTVAIYDSTPQANIGMIFQWSGPLTKTAQETYPLVVTGNVTAPKEHVSLVAGSNSWDFDMGGAIHFPYGPSNARTGQGDVLRFASSFDQSIITGVAPTSTNPTANRLVVAGQDGVAGDSFDGEGGDIYLWAGRGGGTNGNGGDIKVDGGNSQGAGQGGYVKIRGGYSPNGEGGFVNIDAGSSSTGSGGTIQITAGSSNNGDNTYGGSVQIYSGYSNTNGLGGNIYLTTQSGGKIFLEPAANHVYVGSESPGNRVAQVEDLAYIRVAVPTSSLGVSGHVIGMVADDVDYHYYCTANYDGTTHIWKRVAWTAGTWGV